MKESKFQKEVIDEIQELLPDAIIMKNDPNYIQGIPDLTILSGDKWATLESPKMPHTNQIRISMLRQ